LEKKRRLDGRKFLKIEDWSGSKEDYYKQLRILETAYYGSNKAIDATKFVFKEETKTHVVFRSVNNVEQVEQE
jgi:hypothetical protein